MNAATDLRLLENPDVPLFGVLTGRRAGDFRKSLEIVQYS